MPSLTILVPKLLLPYRGVAKTPLPEGIVCSAIVSLHKLEWLLAPHQKRSLNALVHLVLAKCAIHHNDISEAWRHGTHYVIWPTPVGGPNDKLLVQFFLKSHKI